MIVLCVGLPRSGSTWQYQVAADLIERHRDGRRLGWSGGPLPTDGGWAVLKWHGAEGSFKDATDDGRARALSCYRDLRDVACSLMHHLGCSFDDLIDGRHLIAYRRADAYWSHRPATLMQRYEDMVRDPSGAILEIASHLGIALEDGEAADVAERYSLDANRARADEVGAGYDPDSLLHTGHIRAGAVGGWRRELAPEQLSTLAEQVADWLILRGYETDWAWSGPWSAVPSGAIVDLRRQLAEKEAEIGSLARAAEERLGVLREQHDRIADKEGVIQALARVCAEQREHLLRLEAMLEAPHATR